jgi:hypothetical protein
MGLYQDPYSDFGRLALELWRAARLVVDTGLHHKRWPRQQAIDYLIENTPNAPEDCVEAINRYIVSPSQATAYKIGMLKIQELREKAKKALGGKFDIRQFHDVSPDQRPSAAGCARAAGRSMGEREERGRLTDIFYAWSLETNQLNRGHENPPQCFPDGSRGHSGNDGARKRGRCRRDGEEERQSLLPGQDRHQRQFHDEQSRTGRLQRGVACAEVDEPERPEISDCGFCRQGRTAAVQC